MTAKSPRLSNLIPYKTIFNVHISQLNFENFFRGQNNNEIYEQRWTWNLSLVLNIFDVDESKTEL